MLGTKAGEGADKLLGIIIGSIANLAPGKLSTENRWWQLRNWRQEWCPHLIDSVCYFIYVPTLTLPGSCSFSESGSPAFLSIFWACFCCMISFICRILNKQTVLPPTKKHAHRYRELIGGWQRWEVGKGGGERGEYCFYLFSLNKLNKK